MQDGIPLRHQSFLKDIIAQLKESGIRASVFVGTEPRMIEYAALAGADRVELYTEPYASSFHENREAAIAPFHPGSKGCTRSGSRNKCRA